MQIMQDMDEKTHREYDNGMNLFLATSNRHKQKEMQEILKDYTILIPADRGIDFDPVEDGTSFAQNSLIKAKALWELVKEPVIADDSGLCVTALGGDPGIFTSRYAGKEFVHGRPDGKKISQEEQNRLLIEQLNETKSSDRTCHYTCAMVLLVNPDRYFVAQETFEGELIDSIDKQAGSGGFGYDPIVFLPQFGKTVAEISADEKNEISHRGKAARAIANILKTLKI